MNKLTRFLVIVLIIPTALVNAQSPVAHFSASKTAVCDSIYGESFTDQSTNNPTHWKWYFPGAIPDTSTLQNPTNIVYKGYGCYTVKLVVQNNNGADSLTDSNYICLDAPPNVTLVGPSDLCEGGRATITVYGGTQYHWNTGQTTSSINITGVVTETYTVKVTSGACYKDTSITIHVDSAAIFQIRGNTSICIGDSTTLYVVGTHGYTYLWSTGKTTDSIVVDSTKAGSYTYTVTMSKGSCTYTLQITVKVQDCTGIENFYNHSEFIVYPNPGNGIFTIQANGQQLTGTYYIKVYNVLGQQVYGSVTTTEINLSGQPQGIYLYRVITQMGNLVGEGKVLVQR